MSSEAVAIYKTNPILFWVKSKEVIRALDLGHDGPWLRGRRIYRIPAETEGGLLLIFSGREKQKDSEHRCRAKNQRGILRHQHVKGSSKIQRRARLLDRVGPHESTRAVRLTG